MFSREGRFAEARGEKYAQEKVPKKGININTRGRLSMEKLSMVFKDKLMESTCGDGLVAAHNEQGKAHRRRENMIIENHNEGSERGHGILSQDRLDRRLAEIEVQLEIMEGLLQGDKEDQRYGWIFPKKVKWHMLQMKLKNKFNPKWRETFRAVEHEDKSCMCEPEQGKILGEDEDEGKGADEIQKSHIFKSDILCMVTGTMNEEGQFTDIVIKNEEVKQNLNSILEENGTAESHIHAPHN